MLAGGENGLTIWRKVSDNTKDSTFGQIDFGKHGSHLIDGLCILPDSPQHVAIKRSKSGTISVGNIQEMLNDMSKSSKRSLLNSFREIPFKSHATLKFSPTTKCDYIYMAAQPGVLACGDDTGSIWVYETNRILAKLDTDGKAVPAPSLGPSKVFKWPPINNPKEKHKKVVDETKQVVINAVAIDPKLDFIVATTNINLVCIWNQTSSESQTTDE
jgi:hypothetical protein